MSARTSDEHRRRLAELGKRRDEHELEMALLHGDIVVALRESKDVIPRAEAARLLRMQRSTLYRVYGS